jgi:putative ABC transport system permease protein
LIILLGVGEGFANGVFRDFARYAKNTIDCFGGYQSGRGPVLFTMPLLKQLQCNIADIRYITPVSHSNCYLKYKEKYLEVVVVTADVCYHRIAQLVLEKGRFPNDRDALLVQPVCVIGDDLQSFFFGKEDPIGKFVNVAGTYLQIVGTLAKDSSFNYGYRDRVLITSQAFARIYRADILDECNHFKILLQPEADAVSIENQMRSYLAKQLQLSSTDQNAIYIRNVNAQVKVFNKLFHNIRIFLWVISICILLNGGIGISNTMLLTVNERTQEIGIRKVLGASDKETLVMIMSESIFMSLTAGIVGMIGGIGTIHVLNSLLNYIDPNQNLIMGNLVFRLPVAIVALLLVVITGALAGIMPAKRATDILPVKALNTE